ncbi:MAG: ferrous iron transporter B [Tissierellia bacterium]|nr:ferrous iron transporter B [Tissierellia bacterium]
MNMKVALAGNPNSGKTTLFNRLTGSNQYVGNWPGVTVEKKEGKLKTNKNITIVDLPGVYSLSPYTLEEVITRDYLMDERPDAVLNIVDGTNLERNLFLTSQLMEMGIPMVVAINMSDVMKREGLLLNTNKLSGKLGCPVIEISALHGDGTTEAIEAAIISAEKKKIPKVNRYSGTIEHAIAHIEEEVLHHLPKGEQRWYGIKLFERDSVIQEKLKVDETRLSHIEKDILSAEGEMEDDSQSLIATEKYEYIMGLLSDCFEKPNTKKLSKSDKIDRVVTNRILALPIFALVMILVYYISVSTVGTWVTDWTNDGLFGDGWFLGGGSADYEEAMGEFSVQEAVVEAFEKEAQAQGLSPETASFVEAQMEQYDDEGNLEETFTIGHSDYLAALQVEEPDPKSYGNWVPGVPVIVGSWLDFLGVGETLKGLVLDGIVAGVGAVLGFVPQMLVLFLFLALLEGCGYMARVAFIMDRIFRKFGLSGKSFIPMLIGTGCSVPGIMASRTIENDRDRKMTIITTSFIPCGAKLPIIALITGAMFGGAWWVSPSAYFIGITAVVITGIILKKTAPFRGDPAPFVMELPPYHMPTAGYVLRSAGERGWSFIRKAGTVVLLATVLIWFGSSYGWQEGAFGQVDMEFSILARIGNGVAWIFEPLGWGQWQMAVATVTGLIAKENVVGTFGVLFGGFDEVAENGWQVWQNLRQVITPLAAYSFLVFNLLCAPCFAAIGAIKREMNNGKWTAFAVLYQTIFAYVIALIVYQLGLFLTGAGITLWTLIAFLLLGAVLYLLFRSGEEKPSLEPTMQRN